MSTQEASRNILEVQPLTDLWEEMAPSEWKDLPRMYSEDGVFQWNVDLPDGGYERHVAKAAALTLQCKDAQPTKEEVQKLFQAVKDRGDPVAWMQTLASIEYPVFPEGKDPTVKEFFEGSFDPSLISVKTLLVIYPAYEVK